MACLVQFYLPFVIACISNELKDMGCYLVVLNRLFIDKNEGINVFDMCERCIILDFLVTSPIFIHFKDITEPYILREHLFENK